MRFIPIDKMKKLREAAKQGDERAKKILKAQLDGKDFGEDLDAYFAPQPEPVADTNGDGVVQTSTTEAANNGEEIDPGLAQFLADNEVTKDSPEYKDFVEDYYRENPNLVRKDTEPAPGTDAEPGEGVEEEIDLTKDIAEQLINVISCVDRAMVLVLNNDDIEDTTQKGVMVTLQEIKQSILDNFDRIKKVKKTLAKKEEEEELQ